MSKKVTTTIWAVTENEFSDELAEDLVTKYDADSIEGVVEVLERELLRSLRNRTFAETDDVTFLEAHTEVSNE